MSAATAAAALPEVELAPGTLCIGDLHLDVSPAGGDHAPFVRWLAGLRDVPRLVILGDLFDAWIGPAQRRIEPARRACEALAALRARGAAIDVVPGNRDFLLDADFERASGATLRTRGLVGLASGRRLLLVHGDELCTLDLAYQRLKRVLRSPPVLWLAPRVPTPAALWVARRLRGASVRALATKPPAEKEQQRSAAEALLALHGCEELVCGHAHRFRDEPLPGGGRWRVLDAFGHGRDLLRLAPGGALEPASSGVAGGARA